jgi:hypothetical protein
MKKRSETNRDGLPALRPIELTQAETDQVSGGGAGPAPYNDPSNIAYDPPEESHTTTRQ